MSPTDSRLREVPDHSPLRCAEAEAGLSSNQMRRASMRSHSVSQSQLDPASTDDAMFTVEMRLPSLTSVGEGPGEGADFHVPQVMVMPVTGTFQVMLMRGTAYFQVMPMTDTLLA